MIAQGHSPGLASALMKSGCDLVLERCLMKGRDTGSRGAAAAALDHRVDLGGIACENRLDRAVGLVAHPSAEAEPSRSAHGPAPIPDALDPALDAHTHSLPFA